MITTISKTISCNALHILPTDTVVIDVMTPETYAACHIAGATNACIYEVAFLDGLAELRELGVEVGVFGDIDLQPHRDWVERVCGAAGLGACLPLWLEPRRGLLDELFAAGVEATIVTVDTERLGEHFLGRRLEPALIPELEAAGVDACGEEGEFHTVVTAAPLFAAPVEITRRGTLVVDQYRFVEIADVDPPTPATKTL